MQIPLFWRGLFVGAAEASPAEPGAFEKSEQYPDRYEFTVQLKSRRFNVELCPEMESTRHLKVMIRHIDRTKPGYWSGKSRHTTVVGEVVDAPDDFDPILDMINLGRISELQLIMAERWYVEQKAKKKKEIEDAENSKSVVESSDDTAG